MTVNEFAHFKKYFKIKIKKAKKRHIQLNNFKYKELRIIFLNRFFKLIDKGKYPVVMDHTGTDFSIMAN